MQYKTATMKVQYSALAVLARSLQLKFERDMSDGEQIGVVVDNEKVAQHLRTASFDSVELYQNLDMEQQQDLVNKVATALSGLIDRVTKIKIEISTEATERSPETPLEVMQCDDTAFRDLIECHKSRLATSYGITAPNDIWQ
ncbi:hypothetical protein PR001_g8212 [Phytophthora rubi]|uniref:Uncharacterized protein n=1 Tax=Phytophthora rubi TaxID=129364 RepID=A0A6A3N2F5_9STRA|nr:hypothetical protein PR001_g8212 [Phytophthora rubi]